ncbi:MAG: CvpA family protein [Chloroflexi bacterium]|nr:CvpA family protein [Chloroflexota bacterium]
MLEVRLVEILARLSWVDLALVAIMAAGVFVGFTQGMIRYILNAVAVLVAFVLAAQLKGPLVDLLGFWEAFSPEGRQLLIFNLLFAAFLVGGFFAVRALYHRGKMPIARQLDELGGAVFGLLWVVLIVCFTLVVLDSFFEGGGQTGGWVKAVYEALNGSIIVEFLRATVLPVAGFLVRPFIPSEVTDFIPSLR